MTIDTPYIISGGIAIDDRGDVSFANDFEFENVKRFYMVSNHIQGFVRAWHAHQKEGKYVLAVKGAVLAGAVKIDNWESPSENLEVKKFVLSEKKPSVLYIPAGYANGFMSLTVDSKLIFFSTSTLEESKKDDFRYNARFWNIWDIEER